MHHPQACPCPGPRVRGPGVSVSLRWWVAEQRISVQGQCKPPAGTFCCLGLTAHSLGQGPSDLRGHVRPGSRADPLMLGSYSTLNPFAEPLRAWERSLRRFSQSFPISSTEQGQEKNQWTLPASLQGAQRVLASGAWGLTQSTRCSRPQRPFQSSGPRTLKGWGDALMNT